MISQTSSGIHSEDVFYLHINGKSRPGFKDLKLSQEETENGFFVEVWFNSNAISDYRGEKASLPFYVDVDHQESDELKVKRYRIEGTIQLKRGAASSSIVVSLHQNDEKK